jgi:hypothetical protein
MTDSLVGSLTKLDPSSGYSDMYLFSIVHQVGMNLSKETHRGELMMSNYILILRTNLTSNGVYYFV